MVKSTSHVVAMGQEVWSQSGNKAQSGDQRNDRHHPPDFSELLWVMVLNESSISHVFTIPPHLRLYLVLTIALWRQEIHVRRWNDQSSETWSDLSQDHKQLAAETGPCLFLPSQGCFLWRHVAWDTKMKDAWILIQFFFFFFTSLWWCCSEHWYPGHCWGHSFQQWGDHRLEPRMTLFSA